MSALVRTTCPYCGVGCGVAAQADGTLIGDARHPANFGQLCSKGAALKDTLGTNERLLDPIVHGGKTGWDEALDLIAQTFARTIRDHGPDSVAFYVSGQLLTEDYYVANKLMKGFIGSANIDTNSRLCMASSVAGHVRAFGEDVVPGCYDDFEETDLVVLIGSNMAWCHPVLYQRLMSAREKRGTKLVVIDPRRTPTAETADLHLALQGSGDVLLFNGLLSHLDETGAVDRDWVERHVGGCDETLQTARKSTGTIEIAAASLGIDARDLRFFYELFAKTERVMTVYSQGVNQSAVGTDKVNAIINCHLATGRIGRPGMGPFSLTGQPNAMGGREVGGLANQLAAHMGFDGEDIDRVRRFWGAPNIATGPGRKAVDLFDALADKQIKAVWISATNPAATMPNAGRVRQALEGGAFVVVSDCWPTDTTERAHVVLPASGWAEKDGTVTNSERRISRQRAFRPPPGDARPDWWMFAEVGRRMGFKDAFAFRSPADIFREHAALSSFENGGTRRFDIGALANLPDEAYENLEPTFWPCPTTGSGANATRLFARGGFSTPDGRARMIPTPTHASDDCNSSKFPLRLNTGRIRDQWHTMTRTGRVPRLMRHASEPLLDIHPHDAREQGIADGSLVRIESAFGATILRARVSENQKRGDVFAPMHWTDRHASSGPVDAVVTPRTDPISGQPDLKDTAVRIAAVEEFWHGVLLHSSSLTPRLGDSVYWTKAPVPTGIAVALTGLTPLRALVTSEEDLRDILQISAGAELVAFSDPKKSVFRYAAISNGRLEACLFLATERRALPATDAAIPILGSRIDASQRSGLLAGNRGHSDVPTQTIVCACFAVGAGTLTAAIRERGLSSVAEIGTALRAGTNCGSCVPELRTLLRETRSERILSDAI